ncbi:MAG: tRNA 2-thiouridine(34) synthase MnmA [Salinivirgaceae bacterium]|nr:MAG: tRNA 2-thiouridine(34) synthase MnmA [Salinivirgaceae bacterium]
MINNKIVVCFSGGVDSLVSSYLLKEKGYDVIACTFVLNEEQNNKAFIEHAKNIASRLGIDHEVVDLRSKFSQTVLSYFKDGYLKGETPNPCVFCNTNLKWPELFAFANRLGAEKVSMGHYAQTIDLDGNYFVKKGVDPEKEQSFFLWGLSSQQIARIKFPLGNMEKSNVKQIASEIGFDDVVQRKESTGACFTKKDYRIALRKLMSEKENPGFGNFISEEGEVIGRHEGYPFYTVSQRKGLGLNLPERVFINKILPKTNQILLSGPEKLWRKEFYLKDYHIVNEQILLHNEVEVKVRYRKQFVKGRVTLKNDLLKVELVENEWAIAPGQAVAFYYNNLLMGGGYVML